ncbi:MAG: hypothetical protein WA988_02440 [Candidatus Nanopelagicales bacterium]
MKTREAIQVLSASNQLPEPLSPRRRPRRRGAVRAASIMVCSAVIMSGAAVGYSQVSGQRDVVSTWSSTLITAPSAHDLALIDVHEPSIATMVTQLQERYPLAPGASPEQTYRSLDSAFPMEEGSGWPDVAPGDFDPFYYLGFVPTDGPASPPAYVRARDLAGNVAVMAANTWYRYWLNGGADERRVAKAVIEQMPTWSDLVWRVEDGGNPYRVGIVWSMTRAVAEDDEATVRAWFKGHKWLPQKGG